MVNASCRRDYHALMSRVKNKMNDRAKGRNKINKNGKSGNSTKSYEKSRNGHFKHLKLLFPKKGLQLLFYWRKDVHGLTDMKSCSQTTFHVQRASSAISENSFSEKSEKYERLWIMVTSIFGKTAFGVCESSLTCNGNQLFDCTFLASGACHSLY
ncbi:hypothetical protein CEXT_59351 [Caerostris extrusa]|uniref:Uncharacterized protein n=1 Tax=Caerostris extrusa TaxID=172846 RepID=A0AAV4PMP2_CAEEX|nr:hypothetical protein CEXT_59351 [Caerostris extrusa]